MIPKEGSDLWVDTMVVMKASENKDAAFKFINFMLDAKNHAWVGENIHYKVPNKAAMESLAGRCSQQYPNMAMPAAELVKFEQLRDVGDGAEGLFAGRVARSRRRSKRCAASSTAKAARP